MIYNLLPSPSIFALEGRNARFGVVTEAEDVNAHFIFDTILGVRCQFISMHICLCVISHLLNVSKALLNQAQNQEMLKMHEFLNSSNGKSIKKNPNPNPSWIATQTFLEFRIDFSPFSFISALFCYLAPATELVSPSVQMMDQQQCKPSSEQRKG